MSTTYFSSLFLIVLAWPLFLALPMIHARLPWPRHLAIVPAAVLVVLPGAASLELTYLLFGTGFSIDGNNRWVLAMCIVIWFIAATVIKPLKDVSSDDGKTTFFMLTMAGNLGAVISNDLVAFFSFSTLMGYGFYGLLSGTDNAEARSGVRLYLIFLIAADLVLFEALLLAASSTNDLHYAVVRQAMADTEFTPLYVWLVLAGFALKAGVWPLHQWLPPLFNSSVRPGSLLLGGVPIAMAMLGAVRWLPIGSYTFYTIGTAIQVLGVVAIFYALLKMLTRRHSKLFPAWIVIAATGLFIAALGVGLAYPLVWQDYEFLAFPYIAATGIAVAVLSLAVSPEPSAEQYPVVLDKRINMLIQAGGQWIDSTQRWSKNKLLDLQSFYHAAWNKLIMRYQCITTWQGTRGLMPGWGAAITLFVLLGLTLAWLAT